MEQKRILVVGLGLIGASLSMALQGFEDYEVVGAVRSQSTYGKAVARHAADRVTFDHAAELPGADVVILCQDPAGIIGFLREHRDRFKPGCLVWDVCGVKTAVMEASKCLPEGVDFIGCHRMADWCQFGDVIETTPERHDEMIAYTSQMMHVIAVSVCDNEELFSCVGFEGGSFRDCTRVAALDPAMWTQLFTLNAPALSKMVAELEERIHQYRVAIESNDRETLNAMLAHASDRKKQINLERARGDDVHPKF